MNIIYSDELSFLEITEVSHEICTNNTENPKEYLSCIKDELKHNESRLLRLQVGYKSVITNKADKVLIEIAIGNKYWFTPEYIKLKSMFELVNPINILSHNINQIFAENFAAMTDRSYHERRIAIRDFFDIQFLYPLIQDNLSNLIEIIGNKYNNEVVISTIKEYITEYFLNRTQQYRFFYKDKEYNLSTPKLKSSILYNTEKI